MLRDKHRHPRFDLMVIFDDHWILEMAKLQTNTRPKLLHLEPSQTKPNRTGASETFFCGFRGVLVVRSRFEMAPRRKFAVLAVFVQCFFSFLAASLALTVPATKTTTVRPTKGPSRDLPMGRRDAIVGHCAAALALLVPNENCSADDGSIDPAAKEFKGRRKFIEEEDLKITDTVTLTLLGGEFDGTPQRIRIGLYGNLRPNSVGLLKQLLSSRGLRTGCKPVEVRGFQREQLEANKVYNSCMSSRDEGVSLEDSQVREFGLRSFRQHFQHLVCTTRGNGSAHSLSLSSQRQVWRIVKDERIDFGAVVGKFVSREPPFFTNDVAPESDALLPSASEGNVSVQLGNEGAFTFTITPKASKGKKKGGSASIDQDNILVGRVLDSDSMNVVSKINDSAVIKSSKLSYKALSGTMGSKSPTRSCRYGGPMFCNENKPLKKLTIAKIE